VTHKPAAKYDTPVPRSHQRQVERDTLNDTPELRFLRDEIEALLGSTTVQRATRTPRINFADDHDAVAPEELGATESEETVELPERDADTTLETVSLDELADEEDERSAEAEAERAMTRDSFFDRDTEPSVDVKLVREAVRAAGK